MQTLTQPFHSPNYTQIPNALFTALPGLSDPELRILLLVARHTFGWHRERAVLSISFIQNGTGLSKQGVINGTKKLLATGLITREKTGEAGTFKSSGSFSYRMALVVNPVDQPVNLIDPNMSTPLTVPPSEPVNLVDTKKESPLKKGNTSPSPGHADFVRMWSEAYEKFFGRKYIFSGGKDGMAVKRLLTASGMVPNDLIEIARRAWQQQNKFNCRQAISITGFSSRLNEIQAELLPRGGGRLTHKPTGSLAETFGEDVVG